MAWDDVLENLASPPEFDLNQDSMVIQAWHGVAAAVQAMKAGHATVVSPTENCYFDYDIAVTDLRTAHAFRPLTKQGESGCESAHGGRVIGGEFNLWTERMVSPEAVNAMAWPRALATAEVLWAGGGGRRRQARGVGTAAIRHANEGTCRWEAFPAFAARARRQRPLLRALGIREGPSFPGGMTDTGFPLSADSIPVAVPCCRVETALPVLGLRHAEFAADGRGDTYFQSSQAVRAGDEVLLRLEARPLEGCIVVRVRTGRDGQGILNHGVLEVHLSTAAISNFESISFPLRKGTGSREGMPVLQVPFQLLVGYCHVQRHTFCENNFISQQEYS